MLGDTVATCPVSYKHHRTLSLPDFLTCGIVLRKHGLAMNCIKERFFQNGIIQGLVGDPFLETSILLLKSP